RPANAQELYNLHHAQAHNAAEGAFGVMKRRFAILELMREYKFETQAALIPALCLIHNFILHYEPFEINEFELETLDAEIQEAAVRDQNRNSSAGSLGRSSVSSTEYQQALAERDRIAQAMWDQYEVTVLRRERTGQRGRGNGRRRT
ncbi:hypothetical protein BT69DRAFT_1211212, partial [Atractiella rhizophila]